MDDRRSAFARELDAAIVARLQPDALGKRLTQKEIGKRIAVEETGRIRRSGQLMAAGKLSSEEQRAVKWEKRLSSWRNGDALPTSQEMLVLGLSLVAPGTQMSKWLSLWRAALAEPHGLRTTNPEPQSPSHNRSHSDTGSRRDPLLPKTVPALNAADGDVNIYGGQYIAEGDQTVVHGAQSIVHGGQQVLHQDNARGDIMHGDQVTRVSRRSSQDAAETGHHEAPEGDSQKTQH
jgi:hypothetical protein